MNKDATQHVTLCSSIDEVNNETNDSGRHKYHKWHVRPLAVQQTRDKGKIESRNCKRIRKQGQDDNSIETLPLRANACSTHRWAFWMQGVTLRLLDPLLRCAISVPVFANLLVPHPLRLSSGYFLDLLWCLDLGWIITWSRRWASSSWPCASRLILRIGFVLYGLIPTSGCPMRDYVFLSRSAGTLRTHVWQNLADTFWAETLTLFVSLAETSPMKWCASMPWLWTFLTCISTL